MSMTLSFDASLKIKMGSVGGYLNHVARDVDLANGIEHPHSNPNINPGMTKENDTLYYDADAGEMKPCTDSNQIKRALEQRLSSVKAPLRKDAVVLRPLIVQLDPEYYKGLENEDGLYDSVNDMMDWVAEQFGKENIIGASLHLDEGNPHVHVLFCPVTEDCRLSQKDWFDKPSSLRNMHTDFRNYMIDKGYDIDLERKPVRKRLDEKDYRDSKQLEQGNEQLAQEREQFLEEMISMLEDADAERYIRQMESQEKIDAEEADAALLFAQANAYKDAMTESVDTSLKTLGMGAEVDAWAKQRMLNLKNGPKSVFDYISGLYAHDMRMEAEKAQHEAQTKAEAAKNQVGKPKKTQDEEKLKSRNNAVATAMMQAEEMKQKQWSADLSL